MFLVIVTVGLNFIIIELDVKQKVTHLSGK